MAVTEDEIIEILRLQDFFAINDQPFLILPQELLVYLAGNGPAAAAEPVSQSDADGGWQDAEQPLAGFIAEYLFQEFIAMVTRPKSVPMTDEHFFPVVLKCFGLMVDRDVQFFLEISAHPHVMIAGKEMNGDTRIRDRGQLPQNAGIAFGNDRPVFVPEVEEVTYDKDLRRILPDLLQEGDDLSFAHQAGRMVGGTQMKIGEEVDLFSGRDLHGQM